MPGLGERVAPCFGYATPITISTVGIGKVADEGDICLQSDGILDRDRLLCDRQV
jgi:hypothetical protein